MDNNKTDAIIEEKIRRVKDAMAQENIILDENIIQMLRDCLGGKMTFEEARAKSQEKFGKGKTNEK